jgi:hypothetical protein
VRGFFLKVGLSVVIAGLILWLLHRQGFPLIPDRSLFYGASLVGILGYIPIICGTHLFRAWRWGYLLAPIIRVSFWRLISIASVSFMAILLLPFRSGELARPYLISNRERIPMSVAFGTIAVERVIDGLLVSIILVGGLLFSYKSVGTPGWLFGAGLITLGGFLLVLLILILFLWRKELVSRVIFRVFSLFSLRIQRVINRVTGNFIEGLKAMPNWRYFLLFLFFTLCYWGLNGFGMWVLAQGFGLDLSIIGAYTMMGIIAVGVLLPTGPMLLGNFQAAANISLLLYLPSAIVKTQGAAYVFTLYFFQVIWYNLVGLIALFSSHVTFSSKREGRWTFLKEN